MNTIVVITKFIDYDSIHIVVIASTAYIRAVTLVLPSILVVIPSSKKLLKSKICPNNNCLDN